MVENNLHWKGIGKTYFIVNSIHVSNATSNSKIFKWCQSSIHTSFHVCTFNSRSGHRELSRVACNPFWNDKKAEPHRKWAVLCKFSSFLGGLLPCNAYQLCSSNVWILQLHFLHINTIIVFVYLGLLFKWNQHSSNNSHHISYIHKGLYAVKWPDLLPNQMLSAWSWAPGKPLADC